MSSRLFIFMSHSAYCLCILFSLLFLSLLSTSIWSSLKVCSMQLFELETSFVCHPTILVFENFPFGCRSGALTVVSRHDLYFINMCFERLSESLVTFLKICYYGADIFRVFLAVFFRVLKPNAIQNCQLAIQTNYTNTHKF